MKKLFKLILVTTLMLSTMSLMHANVYQEQYYINEMNNYNYLGNIQHAPSYELPKRYDSREHGYITSVKNQGSYETHWIHAMIGASEANILKKGLSSSNENLNLSELAAGYVVYHNKATDTNLTTNDSSSSGLNDFLYGDGHLEGGAFMLSRGGGITSESTLPYSMAESEELSYYLNGNTMLWADYRLKDAIFLSRNDEDAIKDAIIKHGAVALKYQACRINDPKQTYVYRSGGTINSALTIIGYDDTISKELFYKEKPSRDGAWLVKNSWGNTANGGIFYLSYEHLMQDAIAYVYAPSDYYDYNYHYDATPSLTMTSQQANVPLKAANIYQAQKGTAAKPEYLRSVAVGIGSVNTNYEIQIYTNLEDESNPESGVAIFDTPIRGSKNHPGYYSIDLPEPIQLEKDSLFSVVVTLRNRNPRHLTYIYTSESTRFGDYVDFVEGTSEHQSFLFENDSWNDLHYQQKTARIRALTTTNTTYVSKSALDASQFTLKNTEHIYNGAAIEPEVIHTSNLQEGKDYIATYENNILSGDAKVIIQGINAYEGKFVLPFQISKRVLVASMVDDIPTQMSYGQQVIPTERVLFKNRILQKGIDYEVTYGENLSKKGSIIITGKGQFEGTITKEFVIKGLDEMCYFQASVEPADAGSVSIQSSGFAGESINAVTGAYSSDYIFVYWYKDGEVFARENPLKFIAEESATLIAQYRPAKAYADLQDLYIQLKDVENDGYNETTWNQFQTDLEIAEYIVSHYMINDERLGACYYWLSDSYASLSKAEENVIDYEVAKNYLQSIKHQNINAETYTPDSWSVFETAMNLLEQMIQEQNVTSQETLTEVMNQVNVALQQLQERANKSALEQLLKTWKQLEPNDYTKQSWSRLEQAKLQVESMLLNLNASQAEVDALYLEFSQIQLIERGNVSELEELLNEYRVLNAEMYTDSSFQMFQEVISEVERRIEDASNITKDDVGELRDELREAYLELVKKVTRVENFNIEILDYKQVKLSWDIVEEADVYIIQKQKEDGTWSDVNEVTNNMYIHNQKTGMNYIYRIIAKRLQDGYCSEPSAIEEATTLLTGVPSLKLEQISSTKLKLKWTKVKGATRYIVYRKEKGGSYRKVLTLGDVDSYETNSLVPNQYYFIVKAARYDSNNRVMTNGSNEVSGTTYFDKPVLNIEKASNSSVRLKWELVEGVKYYEIYRKSSKTSYKKLKTIKTNEYISKALKVQEVYYFKIRGYKEVDGIKVFSPYSSAKAYRMK